MASRLSSDFAYPRFAVLDARRNLQASSPSTPIDEVFNLVYGATEPSQRPKDVYQVQENTTSCPAIPEYYGTLPPGAATLPPYVNGPPNSTQLPVSLLGPPIPSLQLSRRYALSGVDVQISQPSPIPGNPQVEVRPLTSGDFVQTDGTKFITKDGDFYFAGTVFRFKLMIMIDTYNDDVFMYISYIK